MSVIDRLLLPWADRAAKALHRPVILAVANRNNQGGFETTFAINGLMRAEVEDVARGLLTALAGDLAGEKGCAACEARAARVAAAIAALNADDGLPVAGSC